MGDGVGEVGWSGNWEAVSVADAGSVAGTLRAALRVLRTARQSVPFAVAFLTAALNRRNAG